jgi:hypothetical protein
VRLNDRVSDDGHELGDREVLRVRGLRVSIERLVYATVVLMSVLVVYDGWADLTTYAGVAAVIIGPILALAVAHLFSEVFELHFARQRPLTREEWREVALDQLHLLLAAVPPLVILGIGWLSPLDERRTIAVLLWTGVLTLMGLSLLAARRAGFHGWRLAAACLSGGLVGLIVISLQIVLKPH